MIEVRRTWILNENPRVSEVIVEFPCFKDPEIVSILIINFRCHTCYINVLITLFYYDYADERRISYDNQS